MKRGTCIVAILIGQLFFGCSASSGPKEEYYVRFVSPEEHTEIRGLAELKLEMNLPEPIASLEVGVSGEPLSNFSKMVGDIRLDTTELQNGEKTLLVTVTGESGAKWSDTAEVVVNNPSFHLLDYSSVADGYSAGEEIVLEFTYPVDQLTLTADFSPMDDGFSAAGVTSRGLGAGKYELRYRVSNPDARAEGRYEVTVTAADPNGATSTSPIQLGLRKAPLLPLVIEGATFVDEPSPQVIVDTKASLAISHVTAGKMLISGTPNHAKVDWLQTGAEPADRLIIRSEEYSGYYVVPLDEATDQAVTVPLTLGKPRPSGSLPVGTIELLMAVVDANGITGGWTPIALSMQHTVASGTLVTLWWDNPMDLDLQVQTPGGATVSFDTPSVGGGTLEFDSNSACVLDYRNTERVSWRAGGEVSGTYRVSVGLFDSCSYAHADFHVLIQACGSTEELTGSFEAADLERGDALKFVKEFSVNCSRRAHGRVIFEKPRSGNFSSWPGAAFVPIRAVTGVGTSRKVYAESTTNCDGSFDFYVPDLTPVEYQLEAEASWTLPGQSAPNTRVEDLYNGQVYRYTTGSNIAEQSTTDGQVLSIPWQENSGAFNILDQLQRGFNWVNGHFSALDAKKVKPLIGRWTYTLAPPGGVTNYLSSAINVDGRQVRHDYFDDSVIAHEFIHHVTQWLVGDGPGGAHSFSEPAIPMLAWNEGIATALGQQVLQNPVYMDADGSAVAMIDLEDRRYTGLFDSAHGKDRGTSNGKMNGNLSEVLVAGILWDLLDPDGRPLEESDQIDSTYTQTLGSVARYLPRKGRVNRGAHGIDLVDFLDGWRCQWSSVTAQDAALSLLLVERQFPYDFSTEVSGQ